MYGTIVVGTDGSDTADEAVRRATELAASEGAELHVVMAYPARVTPGQLEAEQTLGEQAWMAAPGEQAERVVRTAAERATEAGVDAVTHIETSDPASALIEVAEAVGGDLIVVGSKGLSGVTRFLLGSVPSRVAHHASCDVLIVRTT
jgi:nucleotide-binding universal stress UspA family protein